MIRSLNFPILLHDTGSRVCDTKRAVGVGGELDPVGSSTRAEVYSNHWITEKVTACTASPEIVKSWRYTEGTNGSQNSTRNSFLPVRRREARARQGEASREAAGEGLSILPQFRPSPAARQSCCRSAIVGGSITSTDFWTSVQYPSSAMIFP